MIQKCFVADAYFEALGQGSTVDLVGYAVSPLDEGKSQ